MSEVLAQLEKKGGGNVKRSLYTGSMNYNWTVFNYTGDIVTAELFANRNGSDYMASSYSNGTKYGQSAYLYMLEVDETNKQVKIRSFGSGVTESYTLLIFTV